MPPPSSGRRGFEYGWVRGTGLAAFIVGTLLSGQTVSAWGLDAIVGWQALGIGAATAYLTLVAGALYARVGAHGFWVMAALCVLACPLTWQLRQPAGRASHAP